MNVDEMMKENAVKGDHARARRDEYRGIPLLVLPMGENREFSFGVGKAKSILTHKTAVRSFAETGDPSSAMEIDHAVKRDEYRGAPLLVLPLQGERTFTFGHGKSKAIVDYLSDVKAFVADNDPTFGADPALGMIEACTGDDRI